PPASLTLSRAEAPAASPCKAPPSPPQSPGPRGGPPRSRGKPFAPPSLASFAGNTPSGERVGVLLCYAAHSSRAGALGVHRPPRPLEEVTGGQITGGRIGEQNGLHLAIPLEHADKSPDKRLGV